MDTKTKMNNSKIFQDDCQRAITWLTRAQWLKGGVKGFVPQITFPFFRFAPYPEITGYSVTLFLKLYQLSHNREYLRRAQLAVDAIKSIQLLNGAYNSIRSRNKPRTIFFDHTIMLNGLLDHYIVTKDQELFDSIERAASFILNNQQLNGSLPEKTYFKGSHFALAKTALPLIKLYSITGEEKYLESAHKLATYTIDHFQKDNGVFSLDSDFPQYNRTHFLCYAIEGLIALEKYRPEILSSVENACKYLVRLRSDKDFIPFAFHPDGVLAIESPDISATAQTARIMLFMYNKFGEEKYFDFSQIFIRYLSRRQYKFKHTLLYGGIPHGYKPILNAITVCSWATMFMTDSLLMLLNPELRKSITF